LLPKVLDEIVTLGGVFEILDLAVGHTRQDTSRATIRVTAPDTARPARCGPGSRRRRAARPGRLRRRVPRRFLLHDTL
jgi:hypothetical protein